MPGPLHNNASDKLLASEWRAILALSGIFSLRMFGLFMLLPLLVLFAPSLAGNTPFLAGLALGAYGLTQALLQIPLGVLSDRINRKLVIAMGLCVFALGSLIAASAESIYGLIIGRAVQGAGAVSSVIMALTADLTRSSQRTKAMALIGVSIGASFMLAMIAGPVLQVYIGVRGIFLCIAVLAALAIVVLYRIVPEPGKTGPNEQRHPWSALIRRVLGNGDLVRLNLGIFVSHAILTSLFLAVPAQFISLGQVSLDHHWKWYVLVLGLSVPAMLPFIILGSRQGRVTLAYRLAVLLLCGAFIGEQVVGLTSFAWMLIFLISFFAAFNALESLLPSLMSQVASREVRGTASSVYSTFQFAGVFVGGAAGGLIWDAYGSDAIYSFCAVLALGWALLAWSGSEFRLVQTIEIDLQESEPSRQSELIAKIQGLKGVETVTLADGADRVYLEVDDAVYQHAELQKLFEN